MAGWYISTQWPSGMHCAPDKLPWSRPAEICGLLRSRPAGMTSHMVIILRWKQGLNCVKRWLNTYHRMAGWYISTQWPSDMHCAPDKLPWSRPAEICGLLRSRPADMTSHMVIILRWKQGLNCVKRWLNTYYRMAGWYISTQWPSGTHLISCHDLGALWDLWLADFRDLGKPTWPLIWSSS